MALESQAPGALPLPSLLLSAGPPALPLSQFLRPRPPWLLSPAPAFVVSNLLISFLRENLLLTSPRLSFLPWRSQAGWDLSPPFCVPRHEPPPRPGAWGFA